MKSDQPARSVALPPWIPDRPPLECLRILVAEDHPAHQYLIRTVLEKAGHQVIVVGDGKLAVQAAKKIPPPDLILMDIQMPEMDGLTAIRAIRAMPDDVARIPIFITSADPGPEILADLPGVGANGFLPKPLDIDQMTAALMKLYGVPPEQSG